MDIAIQHISSFSIVCVSDFVNFELSYKGKDVHIAKRRRVRDAIDSTQTTVITTDMPTDDNDSNLSRYTRPSEDTHAPKHSHTRTHHYCEQQQQQLQQRQRRRRLQQLEQQEKQEQQQQQQRQRRRRRRWWRRRQRLQQ